MFFIHPTDDREEVIAGYAMPDGTILREHVPIRPLVVRALAGIGATPDVYDEILQGVLVDLELEPPIEIGGRFMKSIRSVSRAVKNTARKAAKSKIVRSAWKAVNNPAVMAAMSALGPIGATAGGLMAATKIVGKLKTSRGDANRALTKLLDSGRAKGVKQIDSSIRLAKRALEASNGDLEKAEFALQKTALKALARSNPVAREALKREIRQIKATKTLDPRATPNADKVFSVTAPSGRVYTFRSEE